MSSHFGELPEQLVAAFRAHHLESSFFVEAVAGRLGMTGTDFSCFTLLLLEGPTTAGRLAERMGLTTGAVTGVIDRLERQGRVKRTADPTDRRRVVVEPVTERAADIGPLMGPMLAAMAAMQQRFSADQLRAVLAYATEARRVLAAQTERVRCGFEGYAAVDGAIEVALDGAQRGELRLAGLAAHAVVVIEEVGQLLCRLRFEGAQPSVQAQDGRVVVAARAGVWRAGRGARGTIQLSPAVPWSIEVAGGANRLNADLARGRIESISCHGGASKMELSLPVPEHQVTVKVAGGASRIGVHRPAGVPASVRVRGGASGVVVDGRRLTSMGGEMRVVAPGGHPGYEIEVSGGANHVVVDQTP